MLTNIYLYTKDELVFHTLYIYCIFKRSLSIFTYIYIYIVHHALLSVIIALSMDKNHVHGQVSFTWTRYLFTDLIYIHGHVVVHGYESSPWTAI